MSEPKDQEDREVLDGVHPDRRSFLLKAAGMGFAAPVIASFAMTGMLAGPAYAGGNLST